MWFLGLTKLDEFIICLMIKCNMYQLNTMTLKIFKQQKCLCTLQTEIKTFLYFVVIISLTSHEGWDKNKLTTRFSVVIQVS